MTLGPVQPLLIPYIDPKNIPKASEPVYISKPRTSVKEVFSGKVAEHHPGYTGGKITPDTGSFWSKLKPSWLKTPESITNGIAKVKDWSAKPIAAERLTNAATRLETTAAGTGVKATLAGAGSKLAKGLLTVGRGFPVLSGLIEAGIAKNNGDSFGKAAFKGAGAAAGTWAGLGAGAALALTGPIGWAVGGALAIGGAYAGSKLGGFLHGEDKREQVAQAPAQPHAPQQQFGTMTAQAHAPAVAPMTFDPNDPMAGMPPLPSFS